MQTNKKKKENKSKDNTNKPSFSMKSVFGNKVDEDKVIKAKPIYSEKLGCMIW